MNLENLTTEERLFADALEAQGVPTSKALIDAKLQELADAANLTIANANKYSAFWNFCAAAITAPALWLVAWMVRGVMPQVYAKTATGTMLDLLAWGYGLTRKDAVFATGNIQFARATSAGQLTIPAGTIVRTASINGSIYRMISLVDTLMDIGETTALVACAAESAGADYNLGAAYYSILESAVPEITAVTNLEDWLTSPGADEETDEELRSRMRNQFTAVGDWHTDSKYRAMISVNAPIAIDRIFFDHGIPRGPGSADAYLLFDAGTTPTPYLDALNDYITTEGNHGHGDDLVVKALPETSVDLSFTLAYHASVSEASKTAVKAAVEQMIRCAFRENNNYGVTQVMPLATFSISKLVSEIHAAYPEIMTVTTAASDIVAGLEILRLGTLGVADA